PDDIKVYRFRRSGSHIRDLAGAGERHLYVRVTAAGKPVSGISSCKLIEAYDIRRPAVDGEVSRTSGGDIPATGRGRTEQVLRKDVATTKIEIRSKAEDLIDLVLDHPTGVISRPRRTPESEWLVGVQVNDPVVEVAVVR